jgi:hypothetical protein
MMRGDTTTFVIPTTWNDATFIPAAADWDLIHTVKENESDADGDALYQKETGAGIAPTTGSVPSVDVSILPADSASAVLGHRYSWDVQAQHKTTSEVRTIARGTLVFVRDITQGTTTAVPVNTTAPANVMSGRRWAQMFQYLEPTTDVELDPDVHRAGIDINPVAGIIDVILPAAVAAVDGNEDEVSWRFVLANVGDGTYMFRVWLNDGTTPFEGGHEVEAPAAVVAGWNGHTYVIS